MTPGEAVEAEVRYHYDVDEYGRIITPGKYKDQPWQVVAFHYLMLQGIYDARMAGVNGALYNISKQDRMTYSLPQGVQRVEVYENKSRVEIVFK